MHLAVKKCLTDLPLTVRCAVSSSSLDFYVLSLPGSNHFTPQHKFGWESDDQHHLVCCWGMFDRFAILCRR